MEIRSGEWNRALYKRRERQVEHMIRLFEHIPRKIRIVEQVMCVISRVGKIMYILDLLDGIICMQN